MKKIFSYLLLFVSVLALVGCGDGNDTDEPKTLNVPANVSISETGLITWDQVENAQSYVVTINTDSYEVSVNSYQVTDLNHDFTYSVYAKASGYENSVPSEVKTYHKVIIPPVENVGIGIEGNSSVKSGQSIKLNATITGTTNTAVTWSIKTGAEYATISGDGTLTASQTNEDRIIEVVATSNADSTKTASKVITIIGKPELTQEMLDSLNHDKVSFEGYITIYLYTIGLFEKLEQTSTTVVKTAMDGMNWFAEYENGSTGTTMGMYYQKHNGLACEVGVNFMNEEEYFPMLDENSKETAWEDAGLYNSLKGLTVSDFTFDEETWTYVYSGNNKKLPGLIVSSANPYDFIPTGFGLILEEGEVMGITSVAEPDYTIAEGFKAVQELTVVINYGDSVKVPTVGKYSHEDIHDPLNEAIANMQNLESYTMDFKEITASYISSGYVQKGFVELITQDDCYFTPYEVSYDEYGEEVHTPILEAVYGYHKVNDNLYNTYNLEDGKCTPYRAYNASLNEAKPTFGFVAEIFRSTYQDPEDGSITYYVDDLMSPVASTFYHGVGNDINLYGIFATRGYTSDTDSFTPYVVVKDGYIVEACFYFYVGYIYGVVEIKYSDFNTTTLPENVEVTFEEPRQVPTSWSELTIIVSQDDSTSTEDDVEVNALEQLKTFFEDDQIEEKMPFFGDPLGDTYGFGLTQVHITGENKAVKSILFYYDVPLDVDYTIDSSLKKVEEYLITLGFEKNKYGEFKKGDIMVAPLDQSLDLIIYVWKVN